MTTAPLKPTRYLTFHCAKCNTTYQETFHSKANPAAQSKRFKAATTCPSCASTRASPVTLPLTLPRRCLACSHEWTQGQQRYRSVAKCPRCGSMAGVHNKE